MSVLSATFAPQASHGQQHHIPVDAMPRVYRTGDKQPVSGSNEADAVDTVVNQCDHFNQQPQYPRATWKKLINELNVSLGPVARFGIYKQQSHSACGRVPCTSYTRSAVHMTALGLQRSTPAMRMTA